MAIKMVREPSETPNINNIDDIVPMRYAYGNQNGYVIGKGNEISNTVNGLNFTVNSGRLVLQGVESDIDAVGVTITIDNIATTRYYVVYLQVNLGTNTASILSTYDTATYPTIDVGDDLTENTTGVARLPLYRFTATSGIISDVNKVVESIKYTEDIKVKNSINTDNAIMNDDGTFSSLQRNVSNRKIGISTTNYNLMQYETLYENLNGYSINSVEPVLLPNTAGKMYSGRDLLIIAETSDAIQNSCSCMMSSRPLIKRSNMFSYLTGTGTGAGNVRHFYIELSGGAINSEGIYININSVESDIISPPEITLYKILALN